MQLENYDKTKNYWEIEGAVGTTRVPSKKCSSGYYTTTIYKVKCGLCGEVFTKTKNDVNAINRGKSTKCKRCSAYYSNTQRKPMTGSGLYNSWRGMKNRCTNPNNSAYEWYGGRGITVCKGWLNWDTFREWALKSGWKKGLTIDRIDEDGNYEPSNCQWITRSANASKANADRSNNLLVCEVCGVEFKGFNAKKCRKCSRYVKRECEECGQHFWVSRPSTKEMKCELCR